MLKALTLLMLLWLVPQTARSQDLSEYQIKAVYLFNFASFVEWPAQTGPALAVCILGDDPFGASADKLEGRLVGNRKISVRRLRDPAAVGGCQVCFIARSAAAYLPRVLEAVQNGAVLTVADSEGLAQQGVMINMALSADKIAFDVNVEAAKRANLNVSAKLLQLARTVY